MTTSGNNREKTHYELLGISRESSLREIKTAFRKISLTTHPDRGGSNEAQALINHAYEILSDPARRRRYDGALSATAGKSAVRQQRSGQAGEWEKSFRKHGKTKNIRDRVREEVNRRSEEIRAGFTGSVDAEFADACGSYKKIRGRFIMAAVSAGVFLASGFLYPFLWAGAAAAGYALYRHARFGAGDDAFFILNPEWRPILKRRARKKAALEAEASRARLEELPETVDRLFAVLRRASVARDDEGTVFYRIMVHFFMLGYGPFSHDAGERIAVVSSGDERIAVRYRHRTGATANAAFVKRLRNYMEENHIRKGFLYASPGLSKNAARLAGSFGIVHYTTGDLNAWISGTPSGHYPGPAGDIIEQIDSFMKFLS
ncbi:MAG TPA: DnaJ domain-containing protein [Spirochaetota bacterium]|nr:DnaJ domain-containing protein [Spirochaetota bacterium]HPC40903.1 DnaJ domain-containing protein [Spirochaetota bacterium]HPL16030.1 DnaJ domain-containing protein [Spirochaetota bacterium]HQF08667.1 DnaJ domain-containing protein [Spirochaetota bacterium]HQH97382.1 DnaJ domain-containing protein [Spirochaetota bacterium]